jgi:hypothetical protein
VKLKIPTELDPLWPAYRLVMEKTCSLGDLETLSLLDVEMANDALEVWKDAQRRLEEMSP